MKFVLGEPEIAARTSKLISLGGSIISCSTFMEYVAYVRVVVENADCILAKAGNCNKGNKNEKEGL